MMEFQEENQYYEVPINMNKTIAKTFLWMFLGLASTGIIAAVTYYSAAFEEIILSWPIFAILEIVLVIAFRATFRKCSAGVVTAIFFIYSMINGFTFSAIFACYDLGSISYAFFATAALFGGLAYLGYKTERDISKAGNILLVALIVGLVLSIFNLIIGSGLLAIMLDWLIIAIFCGYTIYDMNTLKMLIGSGEFPEDKIAIYGALDLYLDFINLFIRLLSIFGRSRD